MLKERFDHLRADGALVHNITNYVTVNDVANVLLGLWRQPGLWLTTSTTRRKSQQSAAGSLSISEP